MNLTTRTSVPTEALAVATTALRYLSGLLAALARLPDTVIHLLIALGQVTLMSREPYLVASGFCRASGAATFQAGTDARPAELLDAPLKRALLVKKSSVW